MVDYKTAAPLRLVSWHYDTGVSDVSDVGPWSELVEQSGAAGDTETLGDSERQAVGPLNMWTHLVVT